jgi:hypothetical protein
MTLLAVAFPTGVDDFINAMEIFVPSFQRCFSPWNMDFNSFIVSDVGAPFTFAITIIFGSSTGVELCNEMMEAMSINPKSNFVIIFFIEGSF